MDEWTDSLFWKQELEDRRGFSDFALTERRLNDVINAAPMAEFSEKQLAELGRTVSGIRSNPEKLFLWSVFYDVIYSEKMRQALENDPHLERFGMEDAPAFYLTLVIAGIRHGEKFFKAEKWPLSIYYDGLTDIKVWTDDYETNYGSFGLHWAMAVPWLIVHHTGAVLQFGRLQCNSSAAFFDDVLVFRSSDGKRVIAVLDAEYDFNSAGLIAAGKDPIAFRSRRLVEAYGKVTAHPVFPTGIVGAEPIVVDLNNWEIVLVSGDPVINLHIPATGPLKPELCADSVLRMREFFERCIPSFKPKAFVCHSWLLDPQLHRFLRRDSNLLAFQRAGYMLPSTEPSDAVRRVFGAKAVEHGIDSVPHVSGLQKRLAAFARNGGAFRSGKLFLLNEDLPWGAHPYYSGEEK